MQLLLFNKGTSLTFHEIHFFVTFLKEERKLLSMLCSSWLKKSEPISDGLDQLPKKKLMEKLRRPGSLEKSIGI